MSELTESITRELLQNGSPEYVNVSGTRWRFGWDEDTTAICGWPVSVPDDTPVTGVKMGDDEDDAAPNIALWILTPDSSAACPTCGTICTVEGSSEGTRYFVPVVVQAAGSKEPEWVESYMVTAREVVRDFPHHAGVAHRANIWLSSSRELLLSRVAELERRLSNISVLLGEPTPPYVPTHLTTTTVMNGDSDAH